MKALLASLICYVLFASQCFAIKGGPPYPGGSVPVTGTYAGVLLPNYDVSGFNNSIGLFTVVFPSTGLATGALVIFQTGQTYTGTFQGLADPKGGVVYGLLYATFPYLTTIRTGTDDMGNPIYTTETVVAVASGQLNAKITSAARVTGSATVQFSLTVNNVDSEVIYDVFGFKQA
ncbi:MAG: hypothetical protein ABIR38_05865 [Chthoniobacterales bacterium]